MVSLMKSSQPPYGIVGKGFMATHFKHYLDLLNYPSISWHRHNSIKELEDLACKCSTIFILISDCQIVPFIKQHSFLKSKFLVHFSGQLTTYHATGVHPLMFFHKRLYDLETYEKIPFVVEKQKADHFCQRVTGLKNPIYKISSEQKSLYHALCVIGGNFSKILWQKVHRELKNKLQLPTSILKPYMEETFRDLLCHPEKGLTGPFVRNDIKTIEAHQKALEKDPFLEVYEAFLNTYRSHPDEYQ